MTSTLLGTAAGTALPSTAANTAPVHEFRCLYTHDLRRKQKRWQDGFLKFHTFNKRVMVYDQPRNYIGDTHWKDGDTLYDGDELTLENGVIVQVAEPVATTQTDLTPLLQKKPRHDAPERSATGNVRLPTPGVRTTGLTASAAPRHRPLSQLLGTPKGPHGRAMIPMRSPFEERQANLQRQDDWAASERAAKRRRVAEAGQTWNTAKEGRTPIRKGRESPMLPRTSDTAERLAQNTPLAKKAPRRISGELIDLVSDVEEMYSDVTLPNTPPGFVKPPERPKVRPAPIPPKAREPPPSSSPPVSTSNRVTHVQEQMELREQALKDAEAQPADEEPAQKRTKKLRLAAGNRPKMLLCQDAAPSRKADKTSRPGPSERSVGVITSHVINRGRIAAPPDQNQSRVGKAKPPSEIRKVDNGLTQSSPPDPLGLLDDPAPVPNQTRDGQGLESAANPKSNTAPGAREKAVPDLRPYQHHMDGAIVTKQTTKASRPNLQIQPAPPPENPPSLREFRRIRSENDRPRGKQAAALESHGRAEPPGRDELKGIPGKQAARRQLQRSTSLNVTANNRVREREATPPSPIVDTDIGPWSTEAMDLFDWRPPGYIFHGQGKGFGPPESGAVDGVATS